MERFRRFSRTLAQLFRRSKQLSGKGTLDWPHCRGLSQTCVASCLQVVPGLWLLGVIIHLALSFSVMQLLLLIPAPISNPSAIFLLVLVAPIKMHWSNNMDFGTLVQSLLWSVMGSLSGRCVHALLLCRWKAGGKLHHTRFTQDTVVLRALTHSRPGPHSTC